METKVPMAPGAAMLTMKQKKSTPPGRDDFVCVSEFSELVGPVSLDCFPAEPNRTNFQLEEFVVRIQAADWQSRNAEVGQICDSQAVLTEVAEGGAAAYVHHLTLCDVSARGYVRPMCLSYISYESAKILDHLLELRERFLAVSNLLKRANLIQFVRDLDMSLKDLLYTRNILQKREDQAAQGDTTPIELQDGEAEDDGLVTLGFVEDTLSEMGGMYRRLCAIVVSDSMRSNARMNGRRNSADNRLERPTSPSSSVAARESPSVSPLRTTEDRVVDVLKLSEDPFLMDVFTRIGYFPSQYKPHWFRWLQKGRGKQLKVPDELCGRGVYTTTAKGMLQDILKYFHRSNVVLHLHEDEMTELFPASSLLTVGTSALINFAFDRGNSDARYIGDTTDALDYGDWISKLLSDSDSRTDMHRLYRSASDSVDTESADSEADDPVPVNNDSDRFLKKMFLVKNQQLVERGARQRAIYQLNQRFSPTSAVTSSASGNSIGNLVLLTEPIESFASSLWISSGRMSGYGLLDLVKRCGTAGWLPNIIYSLLVGRTVLVRGSGEQRELVASIANSLSIFILGDPTLRSVAYWRRKPVAVSDLASFRLIGLPSTVAVHGPVLRYASVIDVEKEEVSAPFYAGSFLLDLVNVRKLSFPSEEVFLCYVHSKLLDLGVRASAFYHSCCIPATIVTLQGAHPSTRREPRRSSTDNGEHSPHVSTPAHSGGLEGSAKAASADLRNSAPAEFNATNSNDLPDTRTSGPVETRSGGLVSDSSSTVDVRGNEDAMWAMAKFEAVSSSRFEYLRRFFARRMSLKDHDLMILEAMVSVVSRQVLNAQISGDSGSSRFGLSVRLDYAPAKIFPFSKTKR